MSVKVNEIFSNFQFIREKKMDLNVDEKIITVIFYSKRQIIRILGVRRKRN